MKNLFLSLLVFASSLTAAQQTEQKMPNPFEMEMPKAIIHTSEGDITVELYEDQAPVSVENFLDYARKGFYEGTIFHRVISNFMIQGGGFTRDLQRKRAGESIRNEADNGLSNKRGTIAMARTSAPHSATSQFFINVTDNSASLDHRGKQSGRTWGYAVFGQIIDGMDVVDKIRFVETEARGQLTDIPIEPVVIESVEIR